MDCYDCNGGYEFDWKNDTIKSAYCVCPPKFMIQENWSHNTRDIILTVRGVEFVLRLAEEAIYDLDQSSAWMLFRKNFKEAILMDKRVLDLLRTIVIENFPPYPYGYVSNAYNGPGYDSKWIDAGYIYGDPDAYPKPTVHTSKSHKRPEVDKLPGLKSQVKYPGKFPAMPVDKNNFDGFTMSLEHAIIRLNDKDKWTREQIADWLETLDVDITFRSADANEV